MFFAGSNGTGEVCFYIEAEDRVVDYRIVANRYESINGMELGQA
jgi:hypothetical protein